MINDTSLKIYKENNITANKQNASRSATEEDADLAKVFKIMLAMEQTITVRNIPYDRHPMKITIYNSLQKLANENKLILKSSKKNAIIDFVSCVPEMTTRAVTINKRIHDFFENGMIYFDNNRFPYFNNILATCRKDPTVE